MLASDHAGSKDKVEQEIGDEREACIKATRMPLSIGFDSIEH